MTLRRGNLILSLLLLTAGVLALVFSLTYIPEHGGYHATTTTTIVRTMYETKMVWTNQSLHVCGLIILIVAAVAIGIGGANAYNSLIVRKRTSESADSKQP